jgi:hypothetical protein
VAKKTKSKSGTPKIGDLGAKRQALAMWTLLGEGGEGYGGKLKPEVGKAEREGLEQGGLISVKKRERGAFWLTVTDEGWDWAERHLADPLPEKTQGGAFVLRAWLARLQSYLKAKKVPLVEVLVVELSAPLEPARSAMAHGEVRERIRAAYQDAAGGFDRRLLLRDLRPHLVDIDRQLIDAALMKMLRDGEASLMQLDYRPDVTDEDRAASLQIGNEPRHIIWIAK